MSSRDNIRTLATDLSEVLAWGESAETANAGLNAQLAEKDATIAAKDAEIASLHAVIDRQHDEIERLKAELALYKPAEPEFILGDATRQQFLGAPFTEPFPICYESEFYRSGDDRPGTTIDFDYVVNHTLPDWRGRYPNSPRWIADIEWQNSGGITADEVAKLLPGFQAARQFADSEGKGLKIGGYGFPKRFGTDQTDEQVLAQAAIYQPITDLLDECILTLYPIYTDIERSRTYIRRNIEMGRRIMPGKPVYALGWPTWHANVGAPLAGTEVSIEWWRMFMEECGGADGWAIWLKAATPQPTDEPWWLETLART